MWFGMHDTKTGVAGSTAQLRWQPLRCASKAVSGDLASDALLRQAIEARDQNQDTNVDADVTAGGRAARLYRNEVPRKSNSDSENYASACANNFLQ
jgi:hypothetical protein